MPATTEAEALTTTTEPAPTKKHRKLKVKADAPPKKLSMMAAALKVLQQRKVAMTCPELVDVMATEDLWVSPGGKTPSNTLYAAISRDIMVKGTDSAFRKAERGRFEAS
ncbi:MAG: winged helix-turn-helix domain-containing protein [Gemmatales bacterium]